MLDHLYQHDGVETAIELLERIDDVEPLRAQILCRTTLEFHARQPHRRHLLADALDDMPNPGSYVEHLRIGRQESNFAPRMNEAGVALSILQIFFLGVVSVETVSRRRIFRIQMPARRRAALEHRDEFGAEPLGRLAVKNWARIRRSLLKT